MRKEAIGEKIAKMPLVNGIFFKIHGNELKPDLAEITSQALKICKPHSAFFFGLGKHSLHSFLAAFVKLAQVWRVPVVFDKLKVVAPNVLLNDFYAVSAFGAFEF